MYNAVRYHGRQGKPVLGQKALQLIAELHCTGRTSQFSNQLALRALEG
jgi:hypothetical protein